MKSIRKSIDAIAASGCVIKSLCPRKKGRPSHAMAGEVEERILDAATAVFVQHGFGGASLEHIADAAGASKATLYSRYSGKEALFAAVVRRNSERILLLMHETPPSTSLEQRLNSVAHTIATRLLSDEVIALIRMVIADAPRFPLLAKLTSEAGRSRSVEAVATMIAEFSGQTFDMQTFSERKQRSVVLATQILDAIIPALLMRALMGEKISDVSRDIDSQASHAIGFFAAAGLLDPFL